MPAGGHWGSRGSTSNWLWPCAMVRRCGLNVCPKETPMPAILKVQEAKVQTAQITIKALKVGAKQVTMGLFRQLPYKQILDPETVELRGLPWGHVEYFWESCGYDQEEGSHGPKRHIVWQLDDVLYRCL